MSRDTESQYSKLFEDSPVSLWEEDFSKLKKFIEDLRASGVSDFRRYFSENPEELKKCADYIEILRVNKATLKLQGVESEEELLGPLSRFLLEDAFDLLLNEVVALAEGATKFEETVVLPTITGEPRNILIVLSVPDEFKDTLSRVIVSMLDITETVETKKALDNERKAFQIIAEAAIEPFYTIETSVRILQGMIDLLGFDLGTLRLYDDEKRILRLNASVGSFKDPLEDVSLDHPEYLAAKVARTKKPIFLPDVTEGVIEERPRQVIEELGIKSLIFWPIIGQNEDLVGVLNIASKTKKTLFEADRLLFQQIADMLSLILIRQNTQEALRSSEERYRLLANSVIDVIWIIDMNFNFTFVSPSCIDVVGYRPEELVGQPATAILTEESQQTVMKEMAYSLQMEEEVGKDGYNALPIEVELVHKDGSKVWAEINRVFLRDEAGTPVATLGVARDITDRLLTAQKLEDALQTAAFYNDLMAHDISNIHQGIMSSMELMLHSKELPQEMKHLVRAALSQSKRGAALVSHVKKLSQVEEVMVNLVPTDPYHSLSDAITMVRNTFPEKDIQIETNISEDDFSILADEFLVDVFYNLLHNSVRLDKEKSVRIEINAEMIKDNVLTIRIMDHGPGIDDTRKASLFSRVGTDGRRVAGIGLTLVKRIIDRYHGNIIIDDRVKDDYRKGVCFSLEILTGN